MVYYSLLHACSHKHSYVHTASLHTKQVLAHYLVIDQLIVTADYCQQTALEASQG